MAKILEKLNTKKIHGLVKSRSRDEVLNTYHDMEIKRDMENQFNYARVQDPFSSSYAGLDPRRRNEMADAGMVKEDRKAMSNLSEKGYQAQYPRAGYYTTPYIQDTVDESEKF